MKVVYLNIDSKEALEKRIQIVAGAGNLSRSKGTVTEVINNNTDFESNLKLARIVVGYGHKSISEHDYIVLALEDVTPIVEQTLIGYRLTSFTIKSRRNVDFRNVGFYTPDFKDKNGNILENNNDLKIKYQDYMQGLFNKYGDLVDEELPIEDCRYILPYSYHSNIIMGCDANTFLSITSDLLYGKNSKITELYELGLKFKEIITNQVPYLLRALDKEAEKNYYTDNLSFLDEKIQRKDEKLLEDVNLCHATKNGDEIILHHTIMNRYNLSYDNAHQILENNKDIKQEIIDALLKNKNQRELEHVYYSYEFPISLAALTHITRHRMHSLMVPDFVPLNNLNNYIIPDTLKKNHEKEYQEIFNKNIEMVEYFKKQGARDEDLVYFYLSGNALNIRTTMNARNLKWISRMRCCNKAQWEIRNIANKMVEYAKKETPMIAKCFGPYCMTEGFCPEGKDSCKNRGVVIIKKESNENK